MAVIKQSFTFDKLHAVQCSLKIYDKLIIMYCDMILPPAEALQSYFILCLTYIMYMFVTHGTLMIRSKLMYVKLYAEI